MSQTQKCPFCAEDILVGARKCKHCGEWLDGSSGAGSSDAARAVAKGIKEQKSDEGTFALKVLAAFCACGFIAYQLSLGLLGYLVAVGVFLWLFTRLRRDYYSE